MSLAPHASSWSQLRGMWAGRARRSPGRLPAAGLHGPGTGTLGLACIPGPHAPACSRQGRAAGWLGSSRAQWRTAQGAAAIHPLSWVPQEIAVPAPAQLPPLHACNPLRPWTAASGMPAQHGWQTRPGSQDCMAQNTPAHARVAVHEGVASELPRLQPQPDRSALRGPGQLQDIMEVARLQPGGGGAARHELGGEALDLEGVGVGVQAAQGGRNKRQWHWVAVGLPQGLPWVPPSS